MNTPDAREVIDIAEYSASGKHPPKGQRYRLMLDKTPHVSDEAELTGRQILAFGNMDPQQYNLFQAEHGGHRIPIGADQVVDLTKPGIERFFTMKNEHSNGDGPAKPEFELPADDLAYLRSLDLEWEAFQADGHRWLLIHNWPVPQGLNPDHADIALRIDPNYPMSQIDMAYFRPPISHALGRNMPNLVAIQIRGESWQQWSRHRPPDGWRPGIDSLESHLAYVDHFLAHAVGGN